jgi:hypothetical protein
MQNPAWLLYALAVVLCLGVVLNSPASPAKPSLPDVTWPFTAERKNNKVNEYSSLVNRNGYPNAVVATEPLGIVHVRTARYSSAHTRVVLAPNGCVEAYETAIQMMSDKLHYPALAKSQNARRPKCGPSATGGWTIVRYLDLDDDTAISVITAQDRLDEISVKETKPPIIEVERAAPAKDKSNRRGMKNKQKQPDPDAASHKEVWVSTSQVAAPSTDAKVPYSSYALLISAVGLFIVGVVVHKKNSEKRMSRLFYELDDAEREKFSVIQEATKHLSKSYRTWRIEGKSTTSDWKRNAGASSLVRRVPLSVVKSNPPRVETNVDVTSIDIGSVKLFFLPDVILYLERGTYGGIPYRDLSVEQYLTRFIEDGPVPGDATVVGRTWRYVNKDGGPDRRFNNNAQLPILQYGALVLTSSRGVNIQLNTSNAQESLAFVNCWRALHAKLGNAEANRSAPPKVADVFSTAHEQALKMLGLDAKASAADISGAYRRLAQMYHPDKVSGLAPEFQVIAEQRMKEINLAYESLKQRPT